MSIRSQTDLDGLCHIGQIVAEALRLMQQHLRPGRTTGELDAVCAAFLDRQGARATPRHCYGFPASSCISINDEVVHGIPSARVIQPGDLVKLDVTADCNGYVADAARTVVAGSAAPKTQRLIASARSAFQQAMAFATAGRRIRELGRAVDAEVRRHGARVVRDLCGHGVGRGIHEAPSIPNYYEPRCLGRFTEGLVITVEPIVCGGSGETYQCDDGWTIKTSDGSLAAHHEETLIITRGRPLILTAASQG